MYKRQASRYESSFVAALDRVAALSKSDYPPSALMSDAPPPPRSWAKRHPESFARWNRLRPALVQRAEELQLPVENLLAPDSLRRLAWQPPEDASAAGVDAFLASRMARPWQRELVVGFLTPLIAEP